MKDTKQIDKVVFESAMTTNFEKIGNTGFIKGRCKIAYAGKNRNYSEITLDAFDNAMESLKLIPIVGNWISDKGNFGGHDWAWEGQGNEMKFIDLTKPYGVVPENHNAEWVDISDEYGNVKKYLECDVILWQERYPEQVDKIKNGGVNQSMEIIPTNYDWTNDDYFQIKDFYYSALCLLGRDEDNKDNDVEPCFENAEVIIPFSKIKKFEQFEKDFSEMLNTLTNSFRTEKEEENMDKEIKDVDVVAFESEDTENFDSDNEIVIEFTPEVDEFVDETDVEFAEDDVTEDDVSEDDTSEDDTVEDLNKKDDEDKDEEKYTEHIAEVEPCQCDKLNSQVEELNERINSLNHLLETRTLQVVELTEFKNNILENERQEAINQLFENFAGDLTHEQIAQVKEMSSEFTIEQLEEKMCALAYKNKAKDKKSSKNKSSFSIFVGGAENNEKPIYTSLLESVKK